jgi:ankyrin repeat protein
MGLNPFGLGYSAFNNACIHGHIEMVKYLTTLPSFIETSAVDYGLPWAYNKDQRHIVDYLFERIDEFSIDIADIGPKILEMAISKGDQEYIDKLLARPEVRDANLCQALIKACENGDSSMVSRLLQFQAVDPAYLKIAASNGRLDVLNLLMIHPDLDPASINDELFISGVHHPHIVDRLLQDDRVLFDKTGRSIQYTIKKKLLKYTQILFQAYAVKVDHRSLVKRYRFSLQTAVNTNWLEGVGYLINNDIVTSHNLDFAPIRSSLLKKAKSDEIRALLSIE